MDNEEVNAAVEEQTEDPSIISMIVLLQIRDVLYSLLTVQDAETAKALMANHLEGTILGPAPAMNGLFATNAINKPEESL